MKIVNNRTQRILGSAKLKLQPGANQITDETELTSLQKSKAWQTWADLGWVNVVDAPDPKDVESDLAEVLG